MMFPKVKQNKNKMANKYATFSHTSDTIDV